METLSIFSNIGDWLTGAGVVTIVSAIWFVIKKKGWATLIDRFAKKAAPITQQIGEAFLGTSDVFKKIDAAIKDDGSLIQNSVKDVIESGKTAIAEWDDVIVEIKPKKTSK